MAQIIRRDKALAVNPLKVSQPVGASLAFLGIRNAIPMMHGSQGCTAFAKVFLVRHFREPIPLQTSAMDHGSAVMGADDNVLEGLAGIIGKRKPALVGLPTTGLSETQGTDIRRLVREFRAQHPELSATPVIAVNTPDYSGCLESGYALAVEAMLDALVIEDRSRAGRRPRQVNVLAGSLLTAADIEQLKELIEAFGLTPVVLPDLADALDGHLTDAPFTPFSVGGTPLEAFATLGEAALTLVIGRSLGKAADILAARTGVPDRRFDSLMGLQRVDALVDCLRQLSDQPVPASLERQRAQLQDCMVDTHFMLGYARYAIAADPDLLFALADLVASMGGETVAAVAPAQAPILAELACAQVKIGDLQDLEKLAAEGHAQVLLANSHAAQSAERLDIPLQRAGWPLYDRIGGQMQLWIGYRGTRQTLCNLANLMLGEIHKHEVQPYRSIYAVRPADGSPTHAPQVPPPCAT